MMNYVLLVLLASICLDTGGAEINDAEHAKRDLSYNAAPRKNEEIESDVQTKEQWGYGKELDEDLKQVPNAEEDVDLFEDEDLKELVNDEKDADLSEDGEERDMSIVEIDDDDEYDESDTITKRDPGSRRRSRRRSSRRRSNKTPSSSRRRSSRRRSNKTPSSSRRRSSRRRSSKTPSSSRRRSSRRRSSSPEGGSSGKSKSTSTGGGDTTSCLNSANKYRAKHRDTPNLKWDKGLAEKAQAYAEDLLASAIKSKEKDFLDHDSKKGNVGENLYYDNYKEGYHEVGTPCNDADESWYSEKKNYSFSRGKSNGGDIGHFTAMVWAGSEKVGYGVAIGSGKSRKYPGNTIRIVVARYSPQGNVRGQYKDNVHR